MSGPSDVKDREPSAFEDALLRFETEVGERESRRASLDEIVELIRADREAADR